MFSYAEVAKKCAPIQDKLDILAKGTILHKLRPKSMRGVKYYTRRFYLDMADLCLKYNSSKSSNMCVPTGVSGDGKICRKERKKKLQNNSGAKYFFTFRKNNTNSVSFKKKY